MSRNKYISMTILLLFMAAGLSYGRISEDRKKFENRTVVEKGEHMLNLSFMAASLNSDNSEYMLLLNNMCLNGAFYRVAPSYSYAVCKNVAVGLRCHYMGANANIDNLNLNFLSSDLNFDVKNAKLKYDSWGAAFFSRQYLGLDRRGTVGLYLEEALKYSGAFSDFGGGSTSKGSNISLCVAPGFLLYIVPMVSVQFSIGIAELYYGWTDVYKDNVKVGSREQGKASASFNILNLNFGITYHF